MKVLYFHRKKDPAKPSLYRSFEPLEGIYRKDHEVKDLFLPYGAGSLFNIVRNIIFVYKNRIRDGVNHVTGETHYAILGLIGVPSVLTIHDDYAVSQDRHSGFSHWLKKFLFITLPVKFADKVVCITPTTKKRIDAQVKNEKTQVLTHHDMTSDFPFTPKEFNTDCPVVFHMGTAPNKNLETTLKALQGMKCKLRVLKQMTSEQIKLADSLKIDYVNRYNLTNEEVFEEYRMADIILFPSLYEGLGMPVLEGQSIGRPVITSDLEPMNWVAGKEGAVLIKDPLDADEIRDAVIGITSDSKLRETLVEHGQKNVTRFSLTTIASKYMNIYTDAIKKHQ